MPAHRGKPAAASRPPPPFDGGADGEPTPNDFYFLPDPPPRGIPRAGGKRAPRTGGKRAPRT